MKLNTGIKLATLISIVFLTLLPLKMPVEASPGNLMYITGPGTVTAPETLTFNVSVWIEGTFEKLYLYQIIITTPNDDLIEFKNAWNPNLNSSWVFYGKTFISVAPSYKDTDKDGSVDSVMFGCSLLGEDWVSFSGRRLLSIFELKVKAAPGKASFNINNTDTYLENYYGTEIPVDKQGFEINLEGYLPTEHSEITLEIYPPKPYTYEEITFSGKIIPDKPNVTVTLEYKYEEYSWQTLTKVNTNSTSQYLYTASFDEAGTYRFKASWPGDQTHLGNETEITVTIMKPTASLAVKFAGGETSMGHPNLRTPTRPYIVNVTVENVTDLYSWKVKINYEPFYLKVEEIWLPEDNALAKTGLQHAFNYTLGSSWIEVYASILEPGSGYTGNATLFQFNVTGKYPTAGLSTEIKINMYGSRLENSTGGIIHFAPQNLETVILGLEPTSIEVLNPTTGKNLFTFYTTDTPVGAVFNISIIIRDVVNLYRYNLTLKYNNTLLRLSRVIQPSQNQSYVFHGKQNAFLNQTDEENGTITIYNNLFVGESPFSGTGLLSFVEFEILIAPTNETQRLIASFDLEEASYFNGERWEEPKMKGATFVYIFKVSEGGEEGNRGGGSILEYWPYLLIIVLIIVAVFMGYRRVERQRRARFLEEIQRED